MAAALGSSAFNYAAKKVLNKEMQKYKSKAPAGNQVSDVRTGKTSCS